MSANLSPSPSPRYLRDLQDSSSSSRQRQADFASRSHRGSQENTNALLGFLTDNNDTSPSHYNDDACSSTAELQNAPLQKSMRQFL